MNHQERNEQAIRWLRQFTHDQLKRLQKLQQCWNSVLYEPSDKGHAFPLQPYGAGKWSRIRGEHIDSDGLKTIYHGIAKTTGFDFSLQVYQEALLRVEQRYPGWNRHRYVDGMLLGERRIEWLDKQFPFACSRLASLIFEIEKENNIFGIEKILVSPCDNWGRLAGNVIGDLPAYDDGRVHKHIELVIDQEEITSEDSRHWEELLKQGKLPEIDGAKCSLEGKKIFEYLTEVSDHEIAFINRADARKPLTEADILLFEACNKLDLASIQLAIQRGANLNAINAHEQTPLMAVVGANGFNRYELYEPSNQHASDEEKSSAAVKISDSDELAILETLICNGAHPDLAGIDELTPVSHASLMRCPHIVKFLCNLGADSGIHSYTDGHASEWPDAWDYASTDSWLYGGQYHIVEDILEQTSITPYSEAGTFGSNYSSPETAFPASQSAPLSDAVIDWIGSQNNTALCQALAHLLTALNSQILPNFDFLLRDDVVVDFREDTDGMGWLNRNTRNTIESILDLLPWNEFDLELATHPWLGPCAKVIRKFILDDKKPSRQDQWLLHIKVDRSGKISRIIGLFGNPPASSAFGSMLYPGKVLCLTSEKSTLGYPPLGA